ncbi:MAG TPA: gamma-glutamylcyclotransferase family protein [Pyrinomonadaceae bacterium]|jgi:gamma-glutamylcyclotransferase (GGCT)/AIG2-like uncharacterized protein YtfP
MEYLFSYGTLQKPETQLRIFGRTLRGQRDVLRGWKISPVEIKDEAFLGRGEAKRQNTLIVSETGAETVEGTVFEISAEELALADKYEPENYERFQVLLESGMKAWIYAAAA